jgi:hypothetical protein
MNKYDILLSSIQKLEILGYQYCRLHHDHEYYNTCLLELVAKRAEISEGEFRSREQVYRKQMRKIDSKVNEIKTEIINQMIFRRIEIDEAKKCLRSLKKDARREKRLQKKAEISKEESNQVIGALKQYEKELAARCERIQGAVKRVEALMKNPYKGSAREQKVRAGSSAKRASQRPGFAAALVPPNRIFRSIANVALSSVKFLNLI